MDRTVKVGLFDCAIKAGDGIATIIVKDPARKVVATGSGHTVAEAQAAAENNATSEEARLCLHAAVLPEA